MTLNVIKELFRMQLIKKFSQYSVNVSILRHFSRISKADLMYVYHYKLAFEPDFSLEQSSTLNSRMPFLTNTDGISKEF